MTPSSEQQHIGVEPSTDAQELPRLKIVHFMLWTAVVAVLIAVSNARALVRADIQVLWTVQLLGRLLVTSLPATVALLGIYWWKKGLPFFRAPGAYIVMLGLGYAFRSVFFSWQAGRFAADDYWSGWLWGIASLLFVTWVYLVVVLIKALRSQAVTGWWRSFFIVHLVAHVVRGAVNTFGAHWLFTNLSMVFGLSYSAISVGLTFVHTLFPTAVEVTLLVLAMSEELRAGRSIHWSYWSGIAYWFLNAVYLVVAVAAWHIADYLGYFD